MLRTLCKSKIMGACITDKMLQYSGSIGIDKAIIEAADILPGEQVQVLNFSNGERFTTYVIEEKVRSGRMVLYGPAARKGEVGDELVILSYCLLETKEWHNFKQRFIALAKNNQLKAGK
ncbi:MAG: aspartate 1-decarboxylase [Candidatus Omnitrophica bacterium]|nr:aspartate 1-decarboxylase [Candidatus Omnitrophota bacterium]